MAEKRDNKKKGGKGKGGKGPAYPHLTDPSQRAAFAAFMGMIAGWGLAVTPAIQQFALEAAKNKMGSTEFMLKFRKTKAYARAFPGIMRKNGSLRMSEAQYIAGYNQAVDAAGALGRNFSKQMYGVALANNNSPSEIRAKIEAVDRLKTYAAELQEYNDYLKATGQIKKDLTRGELLEFMLGQRKDLEKGWDVAHTSFMMSKLAGIDVTKGGAGDIRWKELAGLVKRFQSLGGDLQAVDYRKMGSLIHEVIPQGMLYGQGIRDKDVAEMMLDGKNAPDIARRVQNIIDTYTAAVSEIPAHAPTYGGVVAQGTPREQGVGE